MEKFISYIRVSTKRQGQSGLGLEAQQKAVADYISCGPGRELVAEYVEVESGKRTNNRPQLQEAIRHCSMNGAKLIIAKIDRLARNVAFVSALMESGIEFIACDMPTANRFTIHIIAAVAEHEAMMISQRTKAALHAAKARGKVLGGNRAPGQGLTLEAIEKGRALGDVAKREKADRFAARVVPMIRAHQEQGRSLRGIAEELNRTGVLTARGKTGAWTATAIKNILGRVG